MYLFTIYPPFENTMCLINSQFDFILIIKWGLDVYCCFAVSPCAPTYNGVINDSLLWVKPTNVDTVFCTTDWKDLRPLYIIKQLEKAAGYAWLTIFEARAENYSADEYFIKLGLMGVYALKNGYLYVLVKLKLKGYGRE